MDRQRAIGLGALVAVIIAATVVLIATRTPTVQELSAAASSSAAAEAARRYSSPAECQACEQKQCAVLAGECSSRECQDVMTCFRSAKCGTNWDDLDRCYCGDIPIEDCFQGKTPAKGACKQQLEVAAHSVQPLDIGGRFFDRTFDSGKAMQLAQCVLRNCPGCP
jgi:hypothetical protein